MNIGLGAQRRTILLIDNDPHARAVLRNALEAAGFSVGEAANEMAGERTAGRIKPDAILADLLMSSAHVGPMLSERLVASGQDVPCYVLSSGGEALVGAIGLHEIGVSGVFLKPADPVIVIQTLKTRLGVGTDA
jgi:CheY-like chemotaxis protein